MFDSSVFAKLHAGATHFPIALVLASLACEAGALVVPATLYRQRLRSAAFVMILLAGAGGCGAAATGLILTRGQIWGHATLLWHHLFVWPAFALLLALCAWRLRIPEDAPRRVLLLYLALLSITSGLMVAAGYWGGELLNAQPPLAQSSNAPAVTPTAGRALFVRSCAHCHGDDAHGSGEDADGPDLHGLRISDARIRAVITTGIRGEMPSFAKKHGDADIRQITAYLRSL